MKYKKISSDKYLLQDRSVRSMVHPTLVATASLFFVLGCSSTRPSLSGTRTVATAPEVTTTVPEDTAKAIPSAVETPTGKEIDTTPAPTEVLVVTAAEVSEDAAPSAASSKASEADTAPATTTSVESDKPTELAVTVGRSGLSFKRPVDVALDRQSLTMVSVAAEKLWEDGSESPTGRSCATCHSTDALYKDSFVKDYPHTVARVADNSGHGLVDVDEMVNFCREFSMGAPTLKWNSNELLGLSALVLKKQEEYRMSLESMKN